MSILITNDDDDAYCYWWWSWWSRWWCILGRVGIVRSKSFDSFFLDDYPTVEYPDPNDTRVLEFYNLIMKNNVKKNSRFTWFCGQHQIVWPSFSWTKWECDEYNITIPQRVTYLRSTDILRLPLVTFTQDSPLNIPPSIFKRFINSQIIN